MSSKQPHPAKAKWPKRLSPANLLRVFCSLVFIIACGYGGVALIHHFKKAPPATIEDSSSVKPPADASHFEEISKEGNNELLDQGNTSAYLYNQETLAMQYVDQKDYKNAERIMRTVFADVPADKLNPIAYTLMISLQKKLSDTEQYKYYLQLEIDSKKAAGDTEGAATAQKLLDAVK